MFDRSALFSAALMACACLPGLAPAAEPAKAAPQLPPAATRPVDFARDIQPIFAERCNYCHGEEEQEGELRLDAKAIVMKGGKSGPLLLPAKSAESLLIHRLIGAGTEKQMPLDDEPLSAEQIGLIRAWIDQGAKWPDGIGSKATAVKRHWAYVAPQPPPLPAVRNTAWPKSPIDHFVLERLEKEKIAPSAPADRERLVRRVFLDLVGVPPSVEEMDAFLDDASPDAYQRLVDRLLASPRYGERWATPWLDAARYADSNGYQRDGHRTVWPYRDWVIRALNADMPFDQFTIEQLAGDLLPEATIDQKVATGFHRSTTVNVEAGTDEEENRTNQVIDRVNVTGTVWLGTTFECCQCHNHKFDPFTQRDYYQLLAFFNNSPKETEQRTKGSAALEFVSPVVSFPLDDDSLEKRRELEERRKRLANEIDQCVDDESKGLAAWEQEVTADKEKMAKLPANVRRVLAVAAEERRPNQRAVLKTYFVGMSPEAAKIQAQMDELKKQLDALAPPVSLVMTELNEPRPTMIFERGSFLSPGEAVQPGTPRIVHAFAEDAPKNRLGLAQWIVDPANPLVARVQVNRAWSQFFGRGIVVSEEDLGTQSEPPTHPKLLDWLAVEFQKSGWSLKHIHRQIATSATYSQASTFRSDLVAKDPYNVLLARGPRARLTAELIRDSALTASGLLSSKMHGPPVYPPQPDGVWRVTGAVDNTYRTSSGQDAYRRGVYTVWRRSAPYPSFVNFDAPDRSACTVKRPQSNTPLQALTLLNDPVYVSLAQALADRVVHDKAGKSLDEQLTYAFRAVLSRRPQAHELDQLRNIFEQARQRYLSDPKTAQQIAGKRELPAGIAAADWAAWFNTAHVLLNLDEAITKS